MLCLKALSQVSWDGMLNLSKNERHNNSMTKVLHMVHSYICAHKSEFPPVWCVKSPSVSFTHAHRSLLEAVENTLTVSVCRWRETLIFCMSRDGYAMVSPQQVRHTDNVVLWEVRRERRTARAIFKATIEAISKACSDAALFFMPAEVFFAPL